MFVIQLNEAKDDFFIVYGRDCAVILDDQRFRNVIIKDSVVDYDGGPILLENVHFVNCTFRFRQTPNAVHFGEKLLAATPVNIQLTTSPS